MNQQAKDWEAFIASEAGKKCLEPSILGFDENLVRYLKNRLWHAFNAGYEAAGRAELGKGDAP